MPTRCVRGSASPTTTWRTSPTGCARPTSAGGSTRHRRPLRRRLHPQHLEIRPRPHPGRSGAVGRLVQLAGEHAAARRRGQQQCRSRRPAGRVLRTAAERGRRSQRQPVAAGVAHRADRGIRLLTRVDDEDAWQTASWSASSTTSWPGPERDGTALRLPDIRRCCTDSWPGRPARTSAPGR